MKLAGLVLALIMLTQPGGNVVWVEVGHLAIIKTGCQGGHGSVISVGGRELCVKETPAEIRQKIKEAGP
jgi:hypothetical protein